MASARELETLAGHCLVASLAGPELTPSDERDLEDLRPAGVIFFGRHLSAHDPWARLWKEVRRLLPDALFLVDQEGGRVDRLKTLVGPAPAPACLARGGRDAMTRAATATAEALDLLGFDLNCAPVVDLDEGRGEENLLGDRCLGADPEKVAELAAWWIEAHEKLGLITSLKHFPGLGRTELDTHEARPVVRATREEILVRDVAPFRHLLDVAPSVMVSHAAFPELSGEDRPSSLCPKIVTTLLRDELGFVGPVLTDDLDMGAVTDRSPGARAEQAMLAGCDLLLFCHGVEAALEAREALASAAGAPGPMLGRLEEAAARLAPWHRRREGRRTRLATEGELGVQRDELALLQAQLA
ncbi:MAG: glycoside hydrolase family 3 N-terminal domain-containing protein [Acidobacteriota bacterium]